MVVFNTIIKTKVNFLRIIAFGYLRNYITIKWRNLKWLKRFFKSTIYNSFILSIVDYSYHDGQSEERNLSKEPMRTQGKTNQTARLKRGKTRVTTK